MLRPKNYPTQMNSPTQRSASVLRATVQCASWCSRAISLPQPAPDRTTINLLYVRLPSERFDFIVSFCSLNSGTGRACSRAATVQTVDYPANCLWR